MNKINKQIMKEITATKGAEGGKTGPVGKLCSEVYFVPELKFKVGDRVGVRLYRCSNLLKHIPIVIGRILNDGGIDGNGRHVYLVEIAEQGCFVYDETELTLISSSGSTPPIGATPEHRWIDNRIMELSKAIHDHIDKGHKVPRIWIDELTKHLETFNNR